jgi:hypothetical protein
MIAERVEVLFRIGEKSCACFQGDAGKMRAEGLDKIRRFHRQTTAMEKISSPKNGDGEDTQISAD